MMQADAVWLEMTARLAECAALLLGADGRVVGAEAEALALFGCEDVAGVARLWEVAAPRAAALCAEAAAHDGRGCRAEFEIEADGATLGLGVRVLRLGGNDGRCLALLAKPGRRPDDQRVAFARKLGHDLRGPLNAMVLNLDLLRTTLERDEAEEDVVARRRRYIGAIQREIDRMNVGLAEAVTQARGEG
jgi:signal transduction histidine kinase